MRLCDASNLADKGGETWRYVSPPTSASQSRGRTDCRIRLSDPYGRVGSDGSVGRIKGPHRPTTADPTHRGTLCQAQCACNVAWSLSRRASRGPCSLRPVVRTSDGFEHDDGGNGLLGGGEPDDCWGAPSPEPRAASPNFAAAGVESNAEAQALTDQPASAGTEEGAQAAAGGPPWHTLTEDCLLPRDTSLKAPVWQYGFLRCVSCAAVCAYFSRALFGG